MHSPQDVKLGGLEGLEDFWVTLGRTMAQKTFRDIHEGRFGGKQRFATKKVKSKQLPMERDEIYWWWN